MMVTHEDDMAAYADRLIWMVDGRIERDGRPGEAGENLHAQHAEKAV
ncbi:MAG: hypothetical protein R3D85_01600 [Paracoccaceae bacterium]